MARGRYATSSPLQQSTRSSAASSIGDTDDERQRERSRKVAQDHRYDAARRRVVFDDATRPPMEGGRSRGYAGPITARQRYLAAQNRASERRATPAPAQVAQVAQVAPAAPAATADYGVGNQPNAMGRGLMPSYAANDRRAQALQILGLGPDADDATIRSALGKHAAAQQDNKVMGGFLGALPIAGPAARVGGMLAGAGSNYGLDSTAGWGDIIRGRVDPGSQQIAQAIYGSEGPEIAKAAFDSHIADRVSTTAARGGIARGMASDSAVYDPDCPFPHLENCGKDIGTGNGLMPGESLDAIYTPAADPNRARMAA